MANFKDTQLLIFYPKQSFHSAPFPVWLIQFHKRRIRHNLTANVFRFCHLLHHKNQIV